MAEYLLEFRCRLLTAMRVEVGLATQVGCQKIVKPARLVVRNRREKLQGSHRIVSLELDGRSDLREPYPIRETARRNMARKSVRGFRGRNRVTGERQGQRRLSTEI